MKLKLVAVCALAALAASFLCAASASAQIPNANHYVCRKAKDLKIPAKFITQFPLVIDEIALGGDLCELKKLFLYCSPADKNGSPIVDPNLHYCCYKAKCTPREQAKQFDVFDQFGQLRLETKKPFVVCNPCEAIPVP